MSTRPADKIAFIVSGNSASGYTATCDAHDLVVSAGSLQELRELTSAAVTAHWGRGARPALLVGAGRSPAVTDRRRDPMRAKVDAPLRLPRPLRLTSADGVAGRFRLLDSRLVAQGA
jgi:hypothetical protein